MEKGIYNYKKKKLLALNRRFLIAIPVAIGIIVTIMIAGLNFQNGTDNGKNTENMDPRIVFVS